MLAETMTGVKLKKYPKIKSVQKGLKSDKQMNCAIGKSLFPYRYMKRHPYFTPVQAL